VGRRAEGALFQSDEQQSEEPAFREPQQVRSGSTTSVSAWLVSFLPSGRFDFYVPVYIFTSHDPVYTLAGGARFLTGKIPTLHSLRAS
jgi:hypothetical protein